MKKHGSIRETRTERKAMSGLKFINCWKCPGCDFTIPNSQVDRLKSITSNCLRCGCFLGENLEGMIFKLHTGICDTSEYYGYSADKEITALKAKLQKAEEFNVDKYIHDTDLKFENAELKATIKTDEEKAELAYDLFYRFRTSVDKIMSALEDEILELKKGKK